MKRLFSFFLLLSIIIGAGAQTRRYELKLEDFHELKVVDGINVDYQCDPSRAGLIEFDAKASVASAVIFEPKKGKLTISLASRDSAYTGLPTVKVYSSFLSNIKNEGDSTLRVLSIAPTAKFKGRLVGNGRIVIRQLEATEANIDIVSGHGTIVVSGKAQQGKLDLTGGAGQIQGDDFQVDELSVTLAGTGTINCWAVKTLSYGGIGSGKIFYRGTPELKKKFISKVKIAPVGQQ